MRRRRISVILSGLMPLAVVLGLSLMACAAGGCATTDDTESDIPWNAPQPWEGSPYIPGFESQ